MVGEEVHGVAFLGRVGDEGGVAVDGGGAVVEGVAIGGEEEDDAVDCLSCMGLLARDVVACVRGGWWQGMR